MQFLPEKFYSSYASPNEFCKMPFIFQGDTVSSCHITYYGMKGSKVTFQLPFMAENDKKFSAKSIFQSQSNDFSFSAD